MPVTTAIVHISHGRSMKKSEVTFSRRQMAMYIAANQKSPLSPSSMRPRREYCRVMRASCPSALSNEFAHTSSRIPSRLIQMLLK